MTKRPEQPDPVEAPSPSEEQPRAKERELFASLARVKTFPMVPDPTEEPPTKSRADRR